MSISGVYNNFTFFSWWQKLTEAAYAVYNDLMVVTIDVDEFPFWTSQFVPKGYHAKYAYGKLISRARLYEHIQEILETTGSRMHPGKLGMGSLGRGGGVAVTLGVVGRDMVTSGRLNICVNDFFSPSFPHPTPFSPNKAFSSSVGSKPVPNPIAVYRLRSDEHRP